MCRAICRPMAPSPIMPVRLTAVSAIAILVPELCLGLVCRHLHPPLVGRYLIDHPRPTLPPQHHTIVALGGFRRDISFAYVGKDALRRARERLAVPAAARRVEAEAVARLERIIGIAGGQALGRLGVRIDPDVAGAAGLAA